jgi:oxalate decarboxylase/phosphoglucose isomerase-like protein (cupin superfamily)
MATEREYPIDVYRDWQREEGLPVITGLYVQDLKDIELGPWKRRGGAGAFINLLGAGDVDDAYVCEIAPGKSLRPERHLFEELIFVLKGRGATTVWADNGREQTFEWQEGSLFSVPLNARHQHFNGQGSEPARYVAITDAPLMMNLFHNLDFVFNNPFPFNDRFQGEEGYFSGKGEWLWHAHKETNFVPDLRRAEMESTPSRGKDNKHLGFQLSDGLMYSFIAEFPTGTYKKAHRHGPGAHIVILSGQGFSLLWPEGKEKTRIDWQPGSLIVPPQMWFHQHFNTGASPARYLAMLMHSGGKYYISSTLFPKEVGVSLKEGGQQIEYEDEEAAIHRAFESELARNRAACAMKGVVPWCTA